MSAPIGSVHGHRRHAGGQRQEATTWCSTVGCLVTLALLLVPLASEAQRPRTIPRIGYLAFIPGPCTESPGCEGFVQGPRELGYVEGQNLSGKRLELLKDTVPGLARIAVLWNPVEPSAVRQVRDTEDAVRGLGLQVQALEVRGRDEFEGVFA